MNGEIGLSVYSINTILHDHLHLNKVSEKLVSKNLSKLQKRDGVAYYQRPIRAI